VLRRLKSRLGGAPFVQTVFSPASVLGFVVGRPAATTQLGVAENHAQTLLSLIRTQPKVAHQALETITQGLEKLAAASVEAGADGLFFAITKLAREGKLTVAEFEEFGKPYDLRVLKAAAKASFNILHLCGAKVHWKAAVDYPVHALNWASVGQGNPSLAEALKSTDKALIGGVDETELIQRGTPAEVTAAAHSALKRGGSRFLLAPGCCVEPDAPPANLKALRHAVERQAVGS
jgi:uroporphyrinogen decarboxylase